MSGNTEVVTATQSLSAPHTAGLPVRQSCVGAVSRVTGMRLAVTTPAWMAASATLKTAEKRMFTKTELTYG